MALNKTELSGIPNAFSVFTRILASNASGIVIYKFRVFVGVNSLKTKFHLSYSTRLVMIALKLLLRIYWATINSMRLLLVYLSVSLKRRNTPSQKEDNYYNSLLTFIIRTVTTNATRQIYVRS